VLFRSDEDCLEIVSKFHTNKVGPCRFLDAIQSTALCRFSDLCRKF